jgi:hypothetical protein
MTVQIESISAEDTAALAAQARAQLMALPAAAAPLTYQALARALALKPPYTIHRLILALEHTMREDQARDRPFIAARVISRARGGLPAPGFFVLATELGRHDGTETGAGAQHFHAQQLQALADAAAAH